MTTTAAPAGQHVTPDEALALLKEGNRNYVEGGTVRPHLMGAERRAALAQEQKPFCVLVGCSDSRVSPELLFGRGLGDLFIVRNAGNVVDLAAMGSIEYGVAVLGAPLVVVLGHERCGAVRRGRQRGREMHGISGQHRPDDRAHPARGDPRQAGGRPRPARPLDAPQRSPHRRSAAQHRADAAGAPARRAA